MAGGFDLLSSGGHEIAFEGRRVFPLRFLLRHYPIRSQAHGERKVFRERRPRFDASERARGWHVQYDSVEAGHRFIRDAEGLRPYDPHEVRLDLVLRHRGVEDLEAVLVEERRVIARLRSDLAARVLEVERLNADVEQLGREKERLDRDLESRGGEVETLQGHLEARSREKEQIERALSAALEAARRDVERLQGESASLRERIAHIEASLTWRLAGPLRSATEWLRSRA